jgi:aminoglycoside 2''-phosphotransferase
MVDTEIIVKLLQQRYPELVKESIRYIDSGWSNFVVVIGERFIFRFPRTDKAEETLLLEQRVLPVLEKYLPFPIPSFIYSSTPEDLIKYVGYPMVPGKPLKSEFTSLTSAEKERLAHDLGTFLTSLHCFPREIITAEKLETSHTKDLWEYMYRTIKNNAFAYMDDALKSWMTDVFESFLSNSDYFKFNSCLIHGDFKPEHILYDFTKSKLAGVIDFGAMEIAGDPAFDFKGLYRAYGEEFAQRALSHYHGAIDDAFFARMKFYVKTSKFWGLIHAIETNNNEMIGRYLRKLRQIINCKDA